MNEFVEEHRTISHRNELAEYDEYMESVKGLTNSKLYCDIINNSHKYDCLFHPSGLNQITTAFTKLLYENHKQSLKGYGHLLLDKLVPKLNENDKFTALIKEAAHRLVNGGKDWRAAQ